MKVYMDSSTKLQSIILFLGKVSKTPRGWMRKMRGGGFASYIYLNLHNFGEYMYNSDGRKTSTARQFIRKEICNQRKSIRALKCEFKNAKKVQKIYWKKVENCII